MFFKLSAGMAEVVRLTIDLAPERRWGRSQEGEGHVYSGGLCPRDKLNEMVQGWERQIAVTAGWLLCGVS